MKVSNLCASEASAKRTSQGRLFYFDVLRAFACLSVVMIHISSIYAKMDRGGVNFTFGNLFNAVSKAGVPLFVMISGALMLDENYDFKKEKWIARIKKMLCFFVFWSLAYCAVFQVLSPLAKREAIDWMGAVSSFLEGYIHLWFIQMILGLYLLVPLLRLWVKRANRRYVEYFLMISALFTVLIPHVIKMLLRVSPKFAVLNEVMDNIKMSYVVGFVLYFILGWYLHNFELPNKKLAYGLGLFGMGVTIFGTYFYVTLTDFDGFMFYDELTINIFLYSIAIFVLFKSVFGRKNDGTSIFHRAVRLIGKYSLGIYAIHLLIIMMIYQLFSGIHVLLAIPVMFVITVASSLLGTYVLGKIPLLRQFV